LTVVHYHLRPGGVRRVIELATPHLVQLAPEPVSAVVFGTGEAPDADWLRGFRRRLGCTPVKVLVEPAFGYVSELSKDGRAVDRAILAGMRRLLVEISENNCLVWAHNLGLGRNLRLARRLTFTCDNLGIPLIAHHHDWWFDNRWHHFTTKPEGGLSRLDLLANTVLAASPAVCHAAINKADAAVLGKHFPGLSGWLPNPVERETPPTAARLRAAEAWLIEQIGEKAPVWLLPCRLLRRKNIAEALLLTRWLRPEAWLATTGGVSSAEEEPYASTLNAAARRHGWRLRLGLLQGDETLKPSVPELLAASEAVLLTSLQEGFGLPYLEAAAAGRPLIARQLSNIAPDLETFGFTFPQSYREVRVDPNLFDWRSERQRQARLFAEWKRLMPRTASRLAGKPPLLAAGSRRCPVPFSRLTLTAQIEVLARPIEESWARCAPLNPFLETWRTRAAAAQLKISPWPRSAARWLGGAVYAMRFWSLVPTGLARPAPGASAAAQGQFLRQKLQPENLYPLLWNLRT